MAKMRRRKIGVTCDGVTEAGERSILLPHCIQQHAPIAARERVGGVKRDRAVVAGHRLRQHPHLPEDHRSIAEGVGIIGPQFNRPVVASYSFFQGSLVLQHIGVPVVDFGVVRARRQNFPVQGGCGLQLSLLMQGTSSFDLLFQCRGRPCRRSRLEERQEFRFHRRR
jgi:hypothetical protein